MIQVCTRPPEVLPARRLPAEAFCALARQGAGSVYRPRWEVLRMLAVGEAWGAAPADGSPGCALLLLPREADVSLAAALRKALNQNAKDAAVIIVGQRIATVMHADNIIVLKDGRIDGMGTHEQLLQTCDTYREIAVSQLSAEELGLEV